jgi:hypothetical protein
MRQVQTLAPLLAKCHGRVLWTGSRAACPTNLHLPFLSCWRPASVEGTKGTDLYGSAKSAQELLAVGALSHLPLPRFCALGL